MDAANNLDYHRLFPTKSSFVIFWSYISLFVGQGLLVTAAQKQRIFGFNPIIVVLLTELVKLIICVVVYLIRANNGGMTALFYDIQSNKKLLLLYLVPAFLYCLYNNLTFINLELLDVSTYYCLMQFRIVLTAVIYQILFRRRLNLIQWLSLLILTTGCLLKEYGIYSSISQESHSAISNITNSTYQQVSQRGSMGRNDTSMNAIVMFFWSTSLLIFQMFCSCFAGVYNEYLLKDSSTAKNADIMLQNIFMYFNSIVCNIVVFLCSPSIIKLEQSTTPSGPNAATINWPSLSISLYNLLTNPLVVILILNNASSGLVASFFLKSLNSILKTFASAIELFVITILAWILFNDSIDSYSLFALLLITVAMFIYSKNPVSIAPPGKDTLQTNDGFMLLPTSEE